MSAPLHRGSAFAICYGCKTRRTCTTFSACYAIARAKREAETPRNPRHMPLYPNGGATPSLEDQEARVKRDADHVYRCVELGSFPRAVVTHGKTWWANGAGEMWTGWRW